MDRTLRLPEWPPSGQETIGIEQAQRYVGWMEQHIEPVLEPGRRRLRNLYGDDVEIVTRLYAAESIADWSYSPYAPYFTVGCLLVLMGSARPAEISIGLLHDGGFDLVPLWMPAAIGDDWQGWDDLE